MIDEIEAEEQAELERLNEYRNEDLEPEDQVMGSEHAGDLIIFGTPMKFKAKVWRGAVTTDSNTQESFFRSCLPSDVKRGSIADNDSELDARTGSDKQVEKEQDDSSEISEEQDKVSDAHVQGKAFGNIIEMLPLAFVSGLGLIVGKIGTVAMEILVFQLRRLHLRRRKENE